MLMKLASGPDRRGPKRLKPSIFLDDQALHIEVVATISAQVLLGIANTIRAWN